MEEKERKKDWKESLLKQIFGPRDSEASDRVEPASRCIIDKTVRAVSNRNTICLAFSDKTNDRRLK